MTKQIAIGEGGQGNNLHTILDMIYIIVPWRYTIVP